MNLSDHLHCPECQGRLSVTLAHELRCSVCDRTIVLVNGIVDFISECLPLPPGADHYRCSIQEGAFAADLPIRIRSAAGGRWPAGLGDTIEFGCGAGSMTETILSGETVRSLLVVDTDLTMLQARQRRAEDLAGGCPVLFAALGGDLAAIRDAVADTVIGTTVLAGIGDTRAFLTMVHRMMKAGGRAMFVVPNRRYHQAVSLAMAEALTRQYARDRAWPVGSGPALTLLSETRRLLLHRGDQEFLNSLEEKHLFDSEALEELGKQIGFGTADAIPLDPDPAGGQTITRLCQDAGAADDFAQDFGSLSATIGRPYLSLLNHHDSSAFSLLWLTKAIGPTVRTFTSLPAGPPLVHVGPDAAVGGVMPRWSIELLARDTPDGIAVTVGGWCLSNVDALWVRITLDGLPRHAPVWRHRPDVHEVLNRMCLYHSLNAICSGLESNLLFTGVHPRDKECTLGVEIMLTGDLIVTGPAPETLIMDQPTVIAH